MSKESITFAAEDGAVNDALHVAARIHFGGGDVNLIAVTVRLLDGGTVDHAIKTGPERRAHAHGAGLAGGVERVTGKRDCLEPFGGFADGAYFGVGAWIELLHDGVEGAQQKLAGPGVDDGCAEGAGTWGAERARGEVHERGHPLQVVICDGGRVGRNGLCGTCLALGGFVAGR